MNAKAVNATRGIQNPINLLNISSSRAVKEDVTSSREIDIYKP